MDYKQILLSESMVPNNYDVNRVEAVNVLGQGVIAGEVEVIVEIED